jgi:hypothetical protein
MEEVRYELPEIQEEFPGWKAMNSQWACQVETMYRGYGGWFEVAVCRALARQNCGNTSPIYWCNITRKFGE